MTFRVKPCLQGVRDVIAVDELFDCIPAINRSHNKSIFSNGTITVFCRFRSFHHCKAVGTGDNAHGDDYIEFRSN